MDNKLTWEKIIATGIVEAGKLAGKYFVLHMTLFGICKFLQDNLPEPKEDEEA